MDPGHVVRIRPGLRVQRQAVADRGVARDQVAAFAAQEPRSRPPPPCAGFFIARHRKHVAHHLLQPLRENLAKAVALERVGQAGVQRIHVGRQLALAPEVVPDILECREHVRGIQRQMLGHAVQESLRLLGCHAIVAVLVGEPSGVSPNRLAVLAPEKVERPPRQLLAGVPLALATVQQTALPIFGAQLVHQVGAEQALGGAECLGVPFGTGAVVHRDEGGFAALGQAHVVAREIGVDLMAQRFDLLPLIVGVRRSDAGRLPDTRHVHVMLERGLAFFERATDRRRGRRLGGARQRNVPFSGQQTRRGIEADPARTGQVHLAPGVQVGEIGLGATGAVKRFHVTLELDQIARDEARGKAQVAQKLHQQPARIAARARCVQQRGLGFLNAGLHADQVADLALQLLVQGHEIVDRGSRLARQRGEIALEHRRQRRRGAVHRQRPGQRRIVGERKLLGLRLQEKIERIEHRHLGHEIDLDAQGRRALREHQPREVVALRVLLPVDEMLGGQNPHRIAQDARARMRYRPKPHHLRTQHDGPVVPVVGDMVECDVNRHQGSRQAGECDRERLVSRISMEMRIDSSPPPSRMPRTGAQAA